MPRWLMHEYNNNDKRLKATVMVMCWCQTIQIVNIKEHGK